MAIANARKLLARLEARSLSLADSKPPRADIGTAFDALLHAPPRTAEWKRRKHIIDALRLHLWGKASKVHASTPTRSLRDPDATENIDIAGALAFATNRPDDGVRITRAALRRQLAVGVYLFRNWPAFAEQHQDAMEAWTRAVVVGICESARHENWNSRARKHLHFTHIVLRIADTATLEFVQPDHCEECGGYGLEQTGVRVGQSCAKCGGAGVIAWSLNARARAVRVRKQDFGPVWSRPYLALLDHLLALERAGAILHARALGDDG